MNVFLLLLSNSSTDCIHSLVCVQANGACTVWGVRCRWRATCWRWPVTAAACAPEPPWSCWISTRPSSTCGTAARRSCTRAVSETRRRSRSRSSECLWIVDCCELLQQYSKDQNLVSRCVNEACLCQVPSGGRSPQQQQSDHPWVWRGHGTSGLLGGSGEKRQEGLRLYATRCSVYPCVLSVSVRHNI